MEKITVLEPLDIIYDARITREKNILVKTDEDTGEVKEFSLMIYLDTPEDDRTEFVEISYDIKEKKWGKSIITNKNKKYLDLIYKKCEKYIKKMELIMKILKEKNFKKIISDPDATIESKDYETVIKIPKKINISSNFDREKCSLILRKIRIKSNDKEKMVFNFEKGYVIEKEIINEKKLTFLLK